MSEVNLRDYQEEAVKEFFRYVKGGGKNGIIALPTGVGKSYVIAEIIRRILTAKSHIRILNVIHSKELVQSNYSSLVNIWPTCPAGIYSAGIGLKQYMNPVTFAGIQSIHRKPELFSDDHKHIDVIIIDECHLISDKSESMYLSFIKRLREDNPKLVVLGLSATPWRMKMGLLTNGPIFDDIFYDKTKLDDFIKFIEDGHLCDLRPVRTNQEMNLEGVKKIAGEFSEKSLDENLNRDEITKAIVKETLTKTGDRNKGIAFCISISHAENMAHRFREMGLKATAVHSDISDGERDDRMAGIKTGKYNMLCNVGVATTGFDCPDLDYIVMARPSESSSLFCQMLGRGTRPHPSKKDTLVLDFAGNASRLGPINDPVIPLLQQEGSGEAPIRICEKCDTINHAAAKECKHCGEPFPPPRIKLETRAQLDELIKRRDIPKMKWVDIGMWMPSKVFNNKDKEVLKITFQCGKYYYDHYIQFEGNARFYGERNWDMMKTPYKLPDTVDDALELLTEDVRPSSLRVWLNKPNKLNGKKSPSIEEFKKG